MSMNEDDAAEMAAIPTPPSDFQAPQAAPSAAPVYGDAYVAHFTLVLRTVARERPDFRRLYSRRELALAEHFLDRLTPLEQHVYARLFQRKGPWFKTSSLLSYFTRRPWKAVNEESTSEETSIKTDVEVIDVDAIEEANAIEPTPEPTVVDAQPESVLGYLPEAPDHRQVQSTIQTLVNSGLLVTLPLLSPVFMSKEDQEEQLLLALEAIHHSATGPELTALWKKLSGGKTKIPTSSSGRGNASSSSLSSSPARKTNGKLGSDAASTTGNGTSKSEIFQALKRIVMTQRRIDGSRIPIAKMMHAIWLDNYPLLQQRNSKDEILLVVRFSDQARELFARMHRLFYFQAAMPLSGGNMSVSLSASARVKSFQIIAQERSRSSASGGLDAVSYSGSNAATQQWPGLLVIFKKVQYPQYEITIRHPIFRSAETYICYEIASRLHRLMSALELEMVVAQVTKDEDLVPSEWTLSDDLYDNLPELTAFQRLILPPAESAALEEWQGVACGQFEKMLVEWTSMDALVLEARKCLRAYSHFHLQAAAVDENADRPAFFVKCNAGYHLARVLHHASALYEKQRQYARAVVVLRDLLATPSFLARKRAHWYERLALNLEHLKQHREAKRVCEEALRDKDVLGAGIIALQRRLDRLIRRKDLQDDVDIKLDGEQGPPPEKKRKINPDEDDFVNLVSSSDEEFVEAEAAIIEPVIPIIQATSTRYEYPQMFIVGRPLNKSTGEKSRFIGYDDEPCNVEQLVLQYYHSQTDGEHSSGGGWYGVHCEGRVLTNIFGLLMWPVLYASVPDVFQSPYQSAPLDFGFARVFYEARRELIDTLVADIETRLTMEEILERVKSTWQAHEGEITRFVSWGSDVSLRFHLLVVAAMGKSALAKLLRHMATSEEYHRAQNGLPDLLMVRVKTDKAEDVGSLGQYLSDTHIGTLDVYKFCGMSYSTNLNSHKEQDAASKREPDVKEVTQSTEGKKPDEVKSSAGVEDLIGGDAIWQLELKLVEVKGPRDRLSDQQERWLQLFNQDMGIDASVMHVVEEEKELEKKRQRATNGGKGKLKETKVSKVESAPSKRARRK